MAKSPSNPSTTETEVFFALLECPHCHQRSLLQKNTNFKCLHGCGYSHDLALTKKENAKVQRQSVTSTDNDFFGNLLGFIILGCAVLFAISLM